MHSRRHSNLIFMAMIALMAICLVTIEAINPQPKNEGQRMAFQWPFFCFISLWGTAGFFLSRKTVLPDLWQPDISQTKRFGMSALHGLLLGSGTVVLDMIRPVAEVYGLESVHHLLPEAIPVYIYGAIISEFLYHLLPLPLVLYLFSRKFLLGRHHEFVFWLAAIALSFWEIRYQMFDPRFWNVIEVTRSTWSYLANLSELWLFSRYGFLAALNQRLASYSIWHLLWPALQS